LHVKPDPVEFPPRGLVLRGRSGNSSTLWLIVILTGVVIVSDLLVLLQWWLRGQPQTPLFTAVATVLTAATVLLCGTTALAVLGIRRQRYILTEQGIDLPWRGPRPDLHLPWSEIRGMARRYEATPAGQTMGVAIFVAGPDRLLKPRWLRSRRAADHIERFGTPIFLDLSDVDGGTVRFFAATRFYAGQAGRSDLVLN
jgi:hypothetical protein